MSWGLARKIPVEIEYREPDPNGYAVLDLNKGELKTIRVRVEWIHTLEGRIYALPGRDYVIRGVAGELYPIRKTIFNETYKVARELNQGPGGTRVMEGKEGQCPYKPYKYTCKYGKYYEEVKDQLVENPFLNDCPVAVRATDAASLVTPEQRPEEDE